jgi:hypothetical protein
MVASASTLLRPLAGLLSTDSNTINTVNTIIFIAVQLCCEKNDNGCSRRGRGRYRGLM